MSLGVAYHTKAKPDKNKMSKYPHLVCPCSPTLHDWVSRHRAEQARMSAAARMEFDVTLMVGQVEPSDMLSDGGPFRNPGHVHTCVGGNAAVLPAVALRALCMWHWLFTDCCCRTWLLDQLYCLLSPLGNAKYAYRCWQPSAKQATVDHMIHPDHFFCGCR